MRCVTCRALASVRQQFASRRSVAPALSFRLPSAVSTLIRPGSSHQISSAQAAISNYPDQVEAHPQSFAQQGRTFAKGYTIYKTKGAVAFNIIAPKYGYKEDGTKVLDRYGVLLLEFALPRLNEERTYDWEHKEYFALGVNELGEIFADPTQPHRFLHDPQKGIQERYTSTGVKTLDIFPPKSGDPKPCYFLNYRRVLADQSYGNEKQVKQVSVAVLPGEFYIFQRIADYAIPYLLGLQNKWNDGQEF